MAEPGGMESPPAPVHRAVDMDTVASTLTIPTSPTGPTPPPNTQVVIEAKTRGGETKKFDTTRDACAKFGFYAGDRVMTVCHY
jgi:hypothetical protein